MSYVVNGQVSYDARLFIFPPVKAAPFITIGSVVCPWNILYRNAARSASFQIITHVIIIVPCPQVFFVRNHTVAIDDEHAVYMLPMLNREA